MILWAEEVWADQGWRRPVSIRVCSVALAVSDSRVHDLQTLRHRRKPPDSESAFRFMSPKIVISLSDTAKVSDLGTNQPLTKFKNCVVFSSDPGKISSKLRASTVL